MDPLVCASIPISAITSGGAKLWENHSLTEADLAHQFAATRIGARGIHHEAGSDFRLGRALLGESETAHQVFEAGIGTDEIERGIANHEE
jgi:hypothetical protein